MLSRRVDVRCGVSVVWGADLRRLGAECHPRHRLHGRDLRCLDRDAWHAPASCWTRSCIRWPRPSASTCTWNTRGVPPVVNSEHETALIEAAARAELGDGTVVLTPQSMGGEDFAWFLAEIPGAMMRLGTRTPGGESTICTGATTSWTSGPSDGIRVLTAAALRTIRDL